MAQTIAVDLDKTLAKYTTFKKEIGKPVPLMLERVQKWIDKGKEVIIFSARAKNAVERKKISRWLLKYGLPQLEVTNVKQPKMEEFWDDRAVAVVPNTGEIA